MAFPKLRKYTTIKDLIRDLKKNKITTKWRWVDEKKISKKDNKTLLQKNKWKKKKDKRILENRL